MKDKSDELPCFRTDKNKLENGALGLRSLWSSSDSIQLFEAVKRLRSMNVVPSVAELRREGVSERALPRVIVIEFGNEGSAFEGIAPRFYLMKKKKVEPSRVTKRLPRGEQ